MAKLRKIESGSYSIIADDGQIIGAVLKFRGLWWTKPTGEMMPTHFAKTLAEIRQVVKGV